MFAPQNLNTACESLADYWSGRIIGRVNDQFLEVTKLKGELAWHAHDDADEMSLVVRGRLKIEFEDSVAELGEGNTITVPRGKRHNPVAEEECWVRLIEADTTLHTGVWSRAERAAWTNSAPERLSGVSPARTW